MFCQDKIFDNNVYIVLNEHYRKKTQYSKVEKINYKPHSTLFVLLSTSVL